MPSFEALSVDIPVENELSHGEGLLSFQWADPLYGREGLNIDSGGHCSRNMPVRSGDGPPRLVDLRRNSIRLSFTAALARTLELEEEIEIRFTISSEEFCRLQHTVDLFCKLEAEPQDQPDK